MAPVRNLEYIFSDPKWRQLGKGTLKAKGFFPNRVWVNHTDREVAIVLKQTSGWSIGVSVIKHYLESLDVGRAAQVFVVLTNGDTEYLRANTLRNVFANLRGHEPNESDQPDWPDYYWLDENFQVSTSSRPTEECL